MINKLKSLFIVLGIAVGIGVMAPAGVYASVISEQCDGVTDSAVCDSQNASGNDLAKNIVNILLFVVGAISVVMIIVGGILYTTSAGDSVRVTLAKNTLTYAIVGLVISFLAYAIVQFVVSNIK